MRPCNQSQRDSKKALLRACFSIRQNRAAAAVLLTGLVSAGCASQPQIQTMSSTKVRPAEEAFIYPEPGGPAIVSVIERRYANATEQQIALATSSHVSGQNMFRIQLFGPVDSAVAGQTHLREGYLPPANINSDLRQLFPGIRMIRSPYYVQNRYGPFGYAVGRSASGDTCLYGWQRLTSTGAAQTLIGNKGSIQIRLRYCDQSLPEPRLLQAMYGYTISAYFTSRGWNPYGQPNAPNPSLGRAGAPLYPVGATEFATVTTPPIRKSVADGRAFRRQPENAPLPQAEPVGPTVPAPPVTETQGVGDARGEKSAGRESLPAVTVPPPPCDTATAACR